MVQTAQPYVNKSAPEGVATTLNRIQNEILVAAAGGPIPWEMK